MAQFQHSTEGRSLTITTQPQALILEQVGESGRVALQLTEAEARWLICIAGPAALSIVRRGSAP
jgi:hypothetical protein